MKKFLLFTLVAIMFFSCKKEEKFAKFEKSVYSLHYDESVNLNLSSSEPTFMFRYYLSDTHVADVSLEGVAEAHYVGETTVVAKYNDLSAQCNVVVEPYEKLYSLVPVLTGGMERDAVKLLEKAVGRDTLPSSMDALILTPIESDLGLEKLYYSFEDGQLQTLTAFLKSDVTESQVDKFMKERYPYEAGIGYTDFRSESDVAFNKEENKIVYTW